MSAVVQRIPTFGLTPANGPPHHVRSVIADAVTQMRAGLDDAATVVTDAIHEGALDLPEALYLSTRESTRANLGLITTTIAAGGEPTKVRPPEEALAYARLFVHEGLSIDSLVRSYRVLEHVYARLWRRLLQTLALDSAQLADAIAYCEDWLFLYVGAVNERLGAAYSAESGRWNGGSIAMRVEEVRAVLSGAERDLVQASSRLRYRLDGHHLAFVIWIGEQGQQRLRPAGEEHFDLFGEAAGEIGRQLNSGAVLSVPLGGYYAAWATVDPGARPPRELRLNHPGLRIALGRPAKGLAGFRRSHQEALFARRVAGLCPRMPACLSFEQVKLESLLIQDFEEARRYIEDELGPLLEEPRTGRRLIETVEAYLAEGCSYVRAGRRLGIHGNTVAYRVRRVEQLLRRSIGERQLELRTALRLSHFIPPSR